MNTNIIADKLHKHGLKATPQRIWVYGYLLENRTHPDCDEIYEALMSNDKRITRSTVYNSLQALVDHGLAIEVTLDGERVRYDGFTKLHGHFKCQNCGRIYDFEIKRLSVDGLAGFDTRLKDVYFSGVCENCKNNNFKEIN